MVAAAESTGKGEMDTGGDEGADESTGITSNAVVFPVYFSAEQEKLEVCWMPVAPPCFLVKLAVSNVLARPGDYVI